MNVEKKTAPIIGLIRYSQKISFTPHEIDVFEGNYFEYRYKIFTDVTLQSFENQTSKNFLLVIIHSESMPKDYKERFLKLELQYPFLKNCFLHDTEESFNNLLTETKTLIDFSGDCGITFRIDNDDAVPTNFIENLSLFLDAAFIGSCINLPNILIVKRTNTDTYLVEKRYAPSNSMGLAYVTSENNFKTILDINQHHLVNEKNNLILLPRHSGMPIQTINGVNAFNTINDIRSSYFTEEEFQLYLRDNNYSKISLQCLKIFNNKTKKSIQDILNLFKPPIFTAVELRIKSLANGRNRNQK